MMPSGPVFIMVLGNLLLCLEDISQTLAGAKCCPVFADKEPKMPCPGYPANKCCRPSSPRPRAVAPTEARDICYSFTYGLCLLSLFTL